MAAEQEPQLPPAVEAAWGLRERQPRGPRPGLSLSRIVDAAVQVADAEGLAAVSMARVAAALGAAPMSLYRHIAGKEELLTLMVDAAYGPAPESPVEEADWRAGMAAWAWAVRATYQRHPWALRIPISGLPMLPNEVAWFEHGLRLLAATSLSEAAKASVIMLISGYVRNSASVEADISAAVQASGKTPDQWMASFAHTLTRLTDPQRFPALAAFIAAGVFERADPPEAEFTFGLERILDGVAVLAEQHSAQARPLS